MFLVIVFGLMQIQGGMLYSSSGNSAEHLGEKDVSLDMYGWEQIAEEFEMILEKEEYLGNIAPGSPVISHRWFPAANIDYYLASPNGLKVLGLGSLDALHKYAWITQERGGFSMGMDAWFITVSRDFKDPVPAYGPFFSEVKLAYTMPIYRNGKHVMNAFFYYLKDMDRLPQAIIPGEKF
jgi:hypothetical protein